MTRVGKDFVNKTKKKKSTNHKKDDELGYIKMKNFYFTNWKKSSAMDLYPEYIYLNMYFKSPKVNKKTKEKEKRKLCKRHK